MTEEEFLAKFEQSKPCYNAWGAYVVDKIKEHVKVKTSKSLQSFFKIEPTFRLKDAKSIVQKAFHRNKNYLDPWNDITDKVGCRFVVLLLSDIKIVQEAVEEIGEWTFSKDRDFYKEKENEPERFAYQSMHYVVRNKEAIAISQDESSIVEIPVNTPCEIQIRTLMQHAYSEMTHDSIYKSNVKTRNDVIRIASRCSAMIETTDELFEKVNDYVLQLQQKYDRVCSICRNFISQCGVPECAQDTDEEFVKALLTLWTPDYLDAFEKFINEKAKDYIPNEKKLVNIANLQFLYFASFHENELIKCFDENKIDVAYLEDVYTSLGRGMV